MSRRRRKSPHSYLTIVIPIILLILLGYNLLTKEQAPAPAPGSELSGEAISVHFLDVGQGDSIFVELPGGKTMLIDAGEQQYASEIIDFIHAKGLDTLDYVVATHPHSDHIGGMATVLKAFNVGEIWMPNVTHTTATYEKLLQTVADKGLKIHGASAGKSMFDFGGAMAELLAPVGSDYADMNNYSAVVKLTYGDVRFMFTGDAEAVSEREMLDSGADLSADVLKVGHHGSESSSTPKFIDAVKPQYAIISCGVDNSYGHPHSETLKTLSERGITVYDTAFYGTVTVTTNGIALSVSVSGKEQ